MVVFVHSWHLVKVRLRSGAVKQRLKEYQVPYVLLPSKVFFIIRLPYRLLPVEHSLKNLSGKVPGRRTILPEAPHLAHLDRLKEPRIYTELRPDARAPRLTPKAEPR